MFLALFNGTRDHLHCRDLPPAPPGAGPVSRDTTFTCGRSADPATSCLYWTPISTESGPASTCTAHTAHHRVDRAEPSRAEPSQAGTEPGRADCSGRPRRTDTAIDGTVFAPHHGERCARPLPGIATSPAPTSSPAPTTPATPAITSTSYTSALLLTLQS